MNLNTKHHIKQTLIAAIVMLLTSACINYFKDSADKPLKKSLSDFPMQIGDWHGKLDRFDDDIYKILGADDSILVNYRNQKDETIQLYIGYYKSQRKGDIIHSPKNCMPGSGWNIVETRIITINRESQEKDGEQAKVIKLVIKKGIQSQVALYWFHSRGRVIASEYYEKIYLAWDAITKYRTDGSFIRILSPVSDKGEPQTTEKLERFAEQVFPILNDFIPS